MTDYEKVEPRDGEYLFDARGWHSRGTLLVGLLGHTRPYPSYGPLHWTDASGVAANRHCRRVAWSDAVKMMQEEVDMWKAKWELRPEGEEVEKMVNEMGLKG